MEQLAGGALARVGPVGRLDSEHASPLCAQARKLRFRVQSAPGPDQASHASGRCASIANHSGGYPVGIRWVSGRLGASWLTFSYAAAARFRAARVGNRRFSEHLRQSDNEPSRFRQNRHRGSQPDRSSLEGVDLARVPGSDTISFRPRRFPGAGRPNRNSTFSTSHS